MKTLLLALLLPNLTLAAPIIRLFDKVQIINHNFTTQEIFQGCDIESKLEARNYLPSSGKYVVVGGNCVAEIKGDELQVLNK